MSPMVQETYLPGKFIKKGQIHEHQLTEEAKTKIDNNRESDGMIKKGKKGIKT